MPPADSISTTIYEHLTNEEDARSCADIPEQACRETPRSFVLMLLAYFCTKLGDAIASPKTVLSWVMVSVQAPTALVGLLVPIRESGSLIPQLVIASWVRRLEVRKWVWVIGAVVQAAAVAGMGLVAVNRTGAAAGWTLLALLVLFSLARGLSSVAAKDVLGKTVPKRRRGQLTGWSASLAGLVTIGVGGVLLLPAINDRGSWLFGVLLVGAGVLWLAGAGLYSSIREFPGETEGGRNALREAAARLSLLVDDKPFRRFVLTRSLLLCSALSAPFYVVLSREVVGSSAHLLGLFVIAGGLAGLLAAPFWGRFADQSSRNVMVLAGSLSAAIGAAVFATNELIPQVVATAWFVPLAYFILSVAHAGVRVGRKTYVVDLAQGNRRTDYVAVSNTIIGIVLLLAGMTGALATVMTAAGIILVLSLLGFAGAVFAARLPEVE